VRGEQLAAAAGVWFGVSDVDVVQDLRIVWRPG
jgi:hypothetical protein